MNDFKDKVIYQIYPKSFYDTNHDGIGDIQGIIKKLDYLKDLGIDYIWSTPFFVSPMNDNGYDIADYKKINPDFGTMEDVEELIREADKRGIGIMLDMVFNHTSTSHPWFKKALMNDKKYQDYYIFRSSKNAPTNWLSKFGGSAWKYVKEIDKWYLHLFDETQADLNWDNPEVREELKKIILFWKNKGVKGFRFDVINLVSKPDIFVDDYEGDGRRFYSDGPHIHEYLQEIVRDTGIENMITVGEMSSTNIKDCQKYSSKKELSMVFNFHHLKIDYLNNQKWALKDPDYKQLQSLFKTWQEEMQKTNSTNALFWCNHDQPRIVSRLGDETRYFKQSAKMLATLIHMMRGTPYIYQGEEIGMTNAHFTDISFYRDVESLNYYKILLEEGKTKEEALHILSCRSRDNSRTPMQWSNEEHAGFTSSTPWISINENYHDINVDNAKEDPDSILHYYKKLIQLRKDKKLISQGEISFIESDPELIVYKRHYQNEELLVVCNMNNKEHPLPYDIKDYNILLHNYNDIHVTLRPYECLVLEKGA